jgi:hypothetical protein
MVRLQFRVSKKRYLNSKRVYKYRRVSFDIPRKFHSLAAPFFKRDLEMKFTAQDDSIIIVLTTKSKLLLSKVQTKEFLRLET